MRTLNRNKRCLYYATVTEATDAVDDDGFLTGEKTLIYSKPKKLRLNVSPARGESDTEMFGVSLDYDRVIVTENTRCPLSETSVCWVDTLPILKPDGTTDTPHDYKVIRIGKSINGVAVAISRVDVSK